MKAIFKGLIVSCLILLTACASPLTKKELETIRTVGVVNNFSEYPSLTSIGTTVFNNEYDEVKIPTIKKIVTNEVISQISSRGYSAIEIMSKKDKANVDLVMIVNPRDIYGMVGAFGYGFYQRSMFGISGQKQSYVALSLEPTTNGDSRCDTCYARSITDLSIDKMPEKWEEFEETKKEEFIFILKKDIKNAVKSAFDKTGL